MGCGRSSERDDYEEKEAKEKAERRKAVVTTLMNEPKKLDRILNALLIGWEDIKRADLDRVPMTYDQHSMVKHGLGRIINVIQAFDGRLSENDTCILVGGKLLPEPEKRKVK